MALPDTKPVAAFLQARCEAKELAGAVALVAAGDQVWLEAFGKQDLEAGHPMQTGSIFDVMSMTKPVLAVVALQLVEQGILTLDQPVDGWLPELARRQVLRTPESPVDDTVPAKRAITLRDLLTLRLGIGAVMLPPDSTPIQTAMRAAGVDPGFERPSMTPDQWMAKLGSLPLIAQPGERWIYHTGFDVLAVLLARASGLPLGRLLRERLLAPLGMNDTDFSVPPGKHHRVARRYKWEAGKLVPTDAHPLGPAGEPVIFPSELYSTASDYLAFGRFLLGDTQGLLSAERLAMMLQDHITPEQKANSPFFPGFWESHGWGFGLSLVTAGRSAGRFGWDGGAGTSFYCDPKRGMVANLMIQRMFDEGTMAIHSEFWRLVYAG